MSKARELFSSLFRDFIVNGNHNLSFSHTGIHANDMDWIDYLFGKDHSDTNPQFLNRILYYLSLNQQETHDDVVKQLQNRERSSPTKVYTLLLTLNRLLHAETSEQIHDIIEENAERLGHCLFLHESSLGATYRLINKDLTDHTYDPYAMFLRKTAEFLLSLAPEYFSEERLKLYSDAFCAVMLHACLEYRLPITYPNRYLQTALNVRDSRLYCRVTLDICELSLRKKNIQSAYDTLYSWINQESCGKINFFPNCHRSEEQWRKDNPEAVLYLLTAMCTLCTSLSDLQDTSSRHGSSFRSEAISYAKRVLNDEHSDLYTFRRCMAALLHVRAYADAAQIAAKLMDKSPSEKHYLIALLSAEIGVFCQPPKNADHPWRDSRLHEIQGLANRLIAMPVDCFPPFDEERQILDICHTLSPLAAEGGDLIIMLLLCIRHLALEIKHELRYTGCLQTAYDPRIDNPMRDHSDHKSADTDRRPLSIAYYTTLGNLKYLMEPVYTKDPMGKPVPLKDIKETVAPQQAKNCLTMMHAHYMNDPSEGITLPETLSSCINENSRFKNLLFRTHTPSAFREQLLDKQFVFLKSFTDIIDQLNMWSIYGSDRTDGSDSNGCCLCIAPETFEMMLHPLSVTSDLNHDDLQLYKVAYLRNDKIVNRDQLELNHYFELMKTLIQELNDILVLQSKPSEQLLNRVASILQEILTPIIFLFKDASYRAEHELRLIVTRSRKKKDMDRISKTPQTPPKLYVNPYHQVYIDQIILGPKVKEPDNWIPHLQFELTKMWESWPEEKYGKRVPSVRKSSINYRD